MENKLINPRFELNSHLRQSIITLAKNLIHIYIYTNVGWVGGKIKTKTEFRWPTTSLSHLVKVLVKIEKCQARASFAMELEAPTFRFSTVTIS